MDFATHIQDLFDRMKRKNAQHPWVGLPVLDAQGTTEAFLWPVTWDFASLRPETVSLFTQWRKENPTLGTGAFEITEARTEAWLVDKVLARPDRLIFFVVPNGHPPAGHLGFSNLNAEAQSLEVDSVVRGVHGAFPGILSRAMETLMRWGYSEAKAKRIGLSVYSDNDRAVAFYERLQFSKQIEKPMVQVQYPDELRWELAPEGHPGPFGKSYLYMEHTS